VEVLLAVALLAIIAAMVFGSLLVTTRAIDASREQTSREQMVRQVLRLIAEELSMATGTAAFPWVGVNGSQEGQPADAVAFLTASDGLGTTASKESDLMRVVFTREGARLVRFVRRNLYGLTEESLDQVDLADRISGFNVRYFDGQAKIWVDEWPATGSKPPRALLLEITLQRQDADPVTVREWIAVGAL
jgi:general secretion pathway protein J